MKYYSTNNIDNITSFKNVVLKGLADDGGLYMPQSIPALEESFFKNINEKNIADIAFRVLNEFVDGEIVENDLMGIINDAFNFASPVVGLSEKINVLELFHGPTLAFKDFGARFMARTMEYFVKNDDKELNILVATSGDTGSAVANGFYNRKGINVYILYPSGGVSASQEKQLTTLGGNIKALEIKGTFDDCQRMVKEAFLDKELNSHLRLSSANSINVSRFLPQSVYYFDAYKQLEDKTKPLIFCVPSGNLGNLTGGLFAAKMGLPVAKFIGATNSNNVFTEYINKGVFHPKASVKTLSNAMDVGNPSNLARIQNLFNDDIDVIRKVIFSDSYNDEQTKSSIKEVSDKFNYVIDPHGAVGYLALRDYIEKYKIDECNGIILETAHPAKFKDIVDDVIGQEIDIPERLAGCLTKEKVSTLLDNNVESLKEILL